MNPRNPTQTFLAEAEDLLTSIEEIALELVPHQKSDDQINRLFRAFHTVKGSGAMFGFDAVASFTHHVETVLDLVREGCMPLSEELIRLILRSKDRIKELLDAATNGKVAAEAAGAEIVAALKALQPHPEAAAPGATPAGGAKTDSNASTSADNSPEQTYQIHFRPTPDLMVSGVNPINLLDELRDLGECQVEADLSQLPLLDKLQPDRCLLAWNITLTTNRGLNAIKDVFVFVEDGSEIKINTKTPEAAGPSSTAATPSENDNADRKKESNPPAGGGASARKTSGRDASVRVPSERLDRLVNLVGELVMNQSRLSQVAAVSTAANLAGPVEELERLVAELRDNVLGIRMMPIGATFSRFKRLVHDLSLELHKEIDLVTRGEDTELDKTVLDQLGDPLVHVIRNSIDHGIETPEARLKAGKPRRGTIRLAATHVGSNVVITITDDGQGINPEKVHAKAVEKGLIAPDAKLSEQEMYELVFRPGFSTAKEVTGISGRGVGMDVVKRQFEALRGQITMTSQAGKGTTLTLTLPLTLAIIDGLLVEIGQDQFIVPMSVVNENVEIHRSERSRNNGRNVISVRGDLIPYIRLREAFDINSQELDIEKIVIARHGEHRVGLVVDRVLGSHQTVIQPLGRFYRNIGLVSGATIMGDGRVALILDLGGLIRVVEKQQDRTGNPVSGRDLEQSVSALSE